MNVEIIHEEEGEFAEEESEEIKGVGKQAQESKEGIATNRKSRLLKCLASEYAEVKYR